MQKVLCPAWDKLIVALMIVLMAPGAMAQKAKGRAPAQASGAPSGGDEYEKLDVSDLERRYWTPRDTEFNVVQNRTYSKVKRLGVSLGVGTVITDAYVDTFDKTLTLNYFPTERYGFEFNFTDYDGEPSKAVVQSFEGSKGATPDHNVIQKSFGVSFNWVPLYAKMSFLEKRILYYDMYISPGLQMVTYDQRYGDEDGGDFTKSKSQLGISLDVSQVVFLNRHFAFRLDFKNRWYKNEVLKYYESGGSGHPVVSSKVINSNSLIFGFTYLFGGGGEP